MALPDATPTTLPPKASSGSAPTDIERRQTQALLHTDLLGIARLRGSRFSWVNTTFELMFGYEAEELPGLHVRVLYPDGSTAPSMHHEPRRALVRDGSYRTQLRLQKRGGEGVWVDLRATMLSHDESLWMLADITALREQASRIETLSFHDPLTALPNRAMLQQLLERELATRKRRQDTLAVCFIDLDHFKPVNDRKGHAAGDAVLQTVAQRLLDSVRSHDVVGRIGGDEFVVVLTHLDSREQVEPTLSRMLARLGEPIEVDGGDSVRVSASIGVAVCPEDAQTGRALLRCADEAMYTAKAAGHGRWRFHEWSA